MRELEFWVVGRLGWWGFEGRFRGGKGEKGRLVREEKGG